MCLVCSTFIKNYGRRDWRRISTKDVTAPFQIFSGSQLLSDFQTFFKLNRPSLFHYLHNSLCPGSLLIDSNGPVTDYQGGSLGVYDCAGTHNDRNYYRQRGEQLGSSYLYFHTTENGWRISLNKLDITDSALMNARTDSVPPTEGNITSLSHNTISITQSY